MKRKIMDDKRKLKYSRFLIQRFNVLVFVKTRYTFKTNAYLKISYSWKNSCIFDVYHTFLKQGQLTQ